jgi:hypothetical protein
MTARESKEDGGGNRRLTGKAKESEGTLHSRVIEVQETSMRIMYWVSYGVDEE